jgi:hypothetical protein
VRLPVGIGRIQLPVEQGASRSGCHGLTLTHPKAPLVRPAGLFRGVAARVRVAFRLKMSERRHTPLASKSALIFREDEANLLSPISASPNQFKRPFEFGRNRSIQIWIGLDEAKADLLSPIPSPTDLWTLKMTGGKIGKDSCTSPKAG